MIKQLAYGFATLVFITFTLSACGGGNGNAAVSKSTTTTSITLGTPTSDPNLIPPSTTNTPTQVTFYAMVSGGATPPAALSLDQVDATGKVISTDVAQLYDDGLLADTHRGDRVYTGTLDIASNTSVENDYRVSAEVGGKTLTSGIMNFWVSGCPATARPSDPSQAVYDNKTNSTIFANEMIIRTAPGTPPDVDAINNLLGSNISGHVVGCIPGLREFLVEFDNPTSDAAGVYSAIATVKTQQGIADAFPNVQSSVTPDAPINTSLLCKGSITTDCQWYLSRIRAPLAWQIAGGGDPQDAVGVIDFGVDCSQDGLPCDVSLHHQDLIDHGTGVAGLIAAPKSTTGMVGVAWNTQLFPYSFLASNGSQYKMNELIAHDMGQPDVRVINLSAVTGVDFGGQIKDAMCSAIGSGRLIVAAAGNPAGADAQTCQLTNVYPASYNNGSASCSNGVSLQGGLLVVGATDINNNLASWQSGSQPACSNTNYVDLYAPGKDILTLSTLYGYETKSGTSYATPLVSGAAALLWSSHPDYSPAQIKAQLLHSADIMSSGNSRIVTTDSRLVGKPFLDVYRAVGGSDSITNPSTTPNGFSLPDISDAPLQSLVTSSPVNVAGMDSPAPISISGGYYSVNGGPYTNAAGKVYSGDQVRVAVPSSDMDSTTTSAQLDIGGTIAACHVTTHAPHAMPQADDFPEKRDAAPDTDILSNIRSYSGIAPSKIHITGGEYALDGGTTFTSADGVLNPGQQIQLRVHSPNGFSRRARASLSIGNVSVPFSVSTARADRRPDAFTLSTNTSLSGLAPGTVVTSNPVTVAGINVPTVISISGGQFSVTHNGVMSAYTDHSGLVENGDTVTVQLTTAPSNGETTTATLTIGHVTSVLKATTGVYQLSGTVTGVYGMSTIGLTLQDQGGQFTEVPLPPKPVRLMPAYANSSVTYTFSEHLQDGENYAIAVASQPTGYACTVTGGTNNDGTGYINAADVNNIAVSCTPTQPLAFTNGQAASMVVGQPDFTTKTTTNSFVSAVYADNTQLMTPNYNIYQIQDYTLPVKQGDQPAFNIGAATTGTPVASATSLSDPFSPLVANGQFFVSDAFFNRVGIYNSLPTAGSLPETMNVVVGQADTISSASGCTASQLNTPTSISVAGGKLVVADTQNNRVLIWNSIPTTDGTPADMVIGQSDFTHCAPNAGTTTVSADVLDLPHGVWTDGTRLVIADTNNNRVLIWNTFPTIDPTTGTVSSPDVVLGQPDFINNFANLAGDGLPGPDTLYGPSSVFVQNGQLFVADGSNNRVLAWNNINSLVNGQPADYELGQVDFYSSITTPVSASSMASPSGVFVHGNQVYVTDMNNYRVLIFTGK